LNLHFYYLEAFEITTARYGANWRKQRTHSDSEKSNTLNTGIDIKKRFFTKRQANRQLQPRSKRMIKNLNSTLLNADYRIDIEFNKVIIRCPKRFKTRENTVHTYSRVFRDFPTKTSQCRGFSSVLSYSFS